MAENETNIVRNLDSEHFARFARIFAGQLFKRGFSIRMESGTLRQPKANRPTHYTTLSILDETDIQSEFALAYLTIQQRCNNPKPPYAPGILVRIRPDTGVRVKYETRLTTETLPTTLRGWYKVLGFLVSKSMHTMLRKPTGIRSNVVADDIRTDADALKACPIVSRFVDRRNQFDTMPKLGRNESRKYAWRKDDPSIDANGWERHTLSLVEKPVETRVILPRIEDADGSDTMPWTASESRAVSDPAILAERTEWLESVSSFLPADHWAGIRLAGGSIARYVRALAKIQDLRVGDDIAPGAYSISAIRSKLEKARVAWTNEKETLAAVLRMIGTLPNPSKRRMEFGGLAEDTKPAKRAKLTPEYCRRLGLVDSSESDTIDCGIRFAYNPDGTYRLVPIYTWPKYDRTGRLIESPRIIGHRRVVWAEGVICDNGIRPGPAWVVANIYTRALGFDEYLPCGAD